MAVAMSMSNANVHDVHPFFRSNRVGSASSIDTEHDKGKHRRKRQRTASPTDPPQSLGALGGDGWAEQLKAAACGETLPSSTASKRQQVESHTAETHHSTNQVGNIDAARGQRQGGLDVPSSSNITLNCAPQKELEHSRQSGTAGTSEKPGVKRPKRSLRRSSDSKCDLSTIHPIIPDATPPKKMLKVRPDGKLSSPKSKESMQETRPKRSRKSNIADSIPTALVTVLKYGVENASCSALGAKIDDILSGKSIVANLVNTKVSAITKNPKTTHPFFLGGAARVAGAKPSTSGENIHDADADVNDQTKNRQTISPRKARVISKPPSDPGDAAVDRPVAWHTFGTDHARMSRFPGAMEPTWPPQGMLHVGRETIPLNCNTGQSPNSNHESTRRKLKGAEVTVPVEEQILTPFLDLVQTYKSDEIISQRVVSRDWREFRRPLRRLLTGITLQKAVQQELSNKSTALTPETVEDRLSDELSLSLSSQLPAHKALLHVRETIATSSTAFDRFECESQEWVHKYAPITTDDVLQQGCEPAILRSWLRGLATNAVAIPNRGTRESSLPRKVGFKLSKRKRRRAAELDDFLISSDEEVNLPDELCRQETGSLEDPLLKSSTIRGGDVAETLGGCDRSANAIVISGPHGCGKTAAVYAVAQELDFEVFEINAGSRRSGKDITDKVGDMTRNHLVRHVASETVPTSEHQAEDPESSSKNKKDLETRRQGTMNNFFKAKGPKKKRLSETKAKESETSPKTKEAPKKQQYQKQSLILLEEVDVLFEEDKMFWTTILDLIYQSKRPVIMTCTDERLLPLDDMALHAILRLPSPPEQLAVDYLLLISCNEGHLLSRGAISALYKAKGSDLRASISELNFFCQMALGDNKGGLDWLLTSSAANSREGHNCHSTRVVSEGTYQTAMGWLSGELRSSTSRISLELETEILTEAWNGWGLDIGASDRYLTTHASAAQVTASDHSMVETLRSFDRAAEALSAADIFPACVSREPELTLLATSIPEITNKTRGNYTEGFGVLSGDPVSDYSGLSDSLVITLRACARRLSHESHCCEASSMTESSIALMIPELVRERRLGRHLSNASALSGFELIATSTKSTLGVPKGSRLSIFDASVSSVAMDIAPYVRSIVSYDLRLEAQRQQLSDILSGPGQTGKKARTTRSSRAALEGGQKAQTRRERWFPHNTDFNSILRSGGQGWQDVLQQFMMEEAAVSTSAGSRRSSPESAVGSNI